MSRLQAIENALSSINQAAFQELCDSFLILRNSNYSAFSRTGSQNGKQKTVKGTPDTFLLLPNGKFIFVEYSTNITAGLSKIEKDIKKCIDETNTGILLEQIAEIIICVNFNLKVEEIQVLNNLLVNTRIALTVYTLSSLAIELHLNHRDLTHLYLNLPLDTGQIVSIEKFIEEYNRASNGISTPLNNTFLHREQELKTLKESFISNDFIILTGAPGIGKTKLALEGIKDYLKENISFVAYCVSYKNHILLDDLFLYFDSEKDFILFVDDANRIDAFNQITGFYKAKSKGKLKILITVRDYAFQEVGILCQEFSPMRLDLAKFTDIQIIDIIRATPFEILNQEFQEIIVQISDGNPRLAIMTSLLAKAKQNIYALSDVSDLFEKYFATFIKDNNEFSNPVIIKCLGIIAFFYTIPYKNREITSPILKNFGIDYISFIDIIDKLNRLELVDIQFDYLKIPEQNLSTYFFYKAFIKDELLSFNTLLSNYFDNNSDRFRDCMIPATNTFGHTKVINKLLPYLQNYWKTIKYQDDKAFKFLNTFWDYLQTETLEFILKLVEKLPIITSEKYEVFYEQNAFSYYKNNVIELIGKLFIFQTNIKDAIELAFEYCRKKPEHLPELIHKILEQLKFEREDEKKQFTRQFILLDTLLNGLEKGDLLYVSAFYELSNFLLAFKFHHTKGGRNHTISLIDYHIPNIEIIHKFRQKIWIAIDLNFDKYPEDSFKLLKSYSNVRLDIVREVMEFDLTFIIDLINKYLKNDSFEHCEYVQDQIKWCKRNSINLPEFNSLEENFRNKTYETYLKIDWDRLRDKDFYDFDNYIDYEKLKENEVRGYFIFKSTSEIEDFYNIFKYLKSLSKNDWSYNKTLDIIIDENCLQNFEIGSQLINEIIINENEVNYVPIFAFKNILKKSKEAKSIWEIIQNQDFKNKILWELSFFDYIDVLLFNSYYLQAFINTINNISESITIHFDRIQRFLLFEPNLYKIILEIIVKNIEEKNVNIQLWYDVFSVHFDKLGGNIDIIKKAYLQQVNIRNDFDYGSKGLLNILLHEESFLLEYVKNIFDRNHHRHLNFYNNLGFVWQLQNIEPILIEVFDYIVEIDEYYGILDHFCNTFYRDVESENIKRANKFLFNYSELNINNTKKINVVVDIIRHSMKDIFEQFLLNYLSLNQNEEDFSHIWWRGNGGVYSGDVIMGDLEATDWMNILSIVNKSELGYKLIPIKNKLKEKIEYSLRSGDWERQRRFLDRY